MGKEEEEDAEGETQRQRDGRGVRGIDRRKAGLAGSDGLANGNLGTHLGDQRHGVHHPHQHPHGAYSCDRFAPQPSYPEDVHQVVGHLDETDRHQRQRQRQ